MITVKIICCCCLLLLLVACCGAVAVAVACCDDVVTVVAVVATCVLLFQNCFEAEPSPCQALVMFRNLRIPKEDRSALHDDDHCQINLLLLVVVVACCLLWCCCCCCCCCCCLLWWCCYCCCCCCHLCLALAELFWSWTVSVSSLGNVLKLKNSERRPISSTRRWSLSK